MAQKLSPKAAKAKADRDLAYAKTPDRKKKKAEPLKKDWVVSKSCLVAKVLLKQLQM